MGESPISHRSVPWTAVTGILLRSDLGSEKRDFRIFRLFWGAQTPNKGHRHRPAQPPARSGGEQPLVSMRIFVWPRCPPLFCPRSGMGREIRGPRDGAGARGRAGRVCGVWGCGVHAAACWSQRQSMSVAFTSGDVCWEGAGIVCESFGEGSGSGRITKRLKSLKNSLQ